MPVAIGLEREPPVVERRERRAVADRDDRRARQPLLQQPVELASDGSSSDAVASSRNRKSGFCRSARAMPSRCCSPSDSIRFQCASSSSRCASAGRPTALERLGDLLAARRRRAPPDRSPRRPACRPGNTAAAAASSAVRPSAPRRARAERPDAGDGAEQRRLARARRAGHQHLIAAARVATSSAATSGWPAGRRHLEVVEFDGLAVAARPTSITGGVIAAARAALRPRARSPRAARSRRAIRRAAR